MGLMNWTPLIQTERGGVTECVHFGAVAVVDAQGTLLARAGSPSLLTFTRSTLKPLQALPFIEGGGAEHFKLESAQIAMLCASHNGEDRHVAQVERLLTATRLGHQRLQCGCHTPYFVELGVKGPGGPYDERHHNCSGKHAGFLAYCVQHQLPLDTYLAADHPLQQAIEAAVMRVCDLGADQIAVGTDGCSAINYAMPLAHLALAYARLAAGTASPHFGPSLARLSQAMREHPDLVSGTGRNDEAFMRIGRGDWVSKVGADGVQAMGSVSRGLGFAIKIADGSKPALFAASVAVMDQLGWLDQAQRQALKPWQAESILSVKGQLVGARRAIFQLKRV
jgi:L-asparaginase II